MSCDTTPDLRLILVGSQRYGADSVANTILGGSFKWGRRTAHSVTHTGQVNGKVIQLVKAPMWFRGYHLCDTAELVKEELVLSVTHCKPGPHAFIVLVEADLPFTDACAKAVEAHLELYGKDVWNHTVVLFTCVDYLGNPDPEDYIAGEGEGLIQLLQRCGQRFVFDHTEERQTLTQRLLEKVETLMERNWGRHFEIEEKGLQRILQKREEVKMRAESRRQRRIKEKETQEKESGTSTSAVTIILLGWVCASKTTVRSAILGIPKDEGRTEKCVKQTKVIGKRQLKVTVVDTPGWWKYFPASLVQSAVRSEIMKALDQDEATTHTSAKENPQDQASSGQAFLLMVPADTSFTDEQRKIIEDNMRPLGETVWQNTILVFTRRSWLGEYHIEQHIESEGEALTWLVEKCGNRYFVFNDETEEQSILKTQSEELLDMVEEMLSRGQNTPKKETRQIAETKDHREASEGPVDEDLKKIADQLHRMWDWRSWEAEEVMARFDERPMEDCTCDEDSMRRHLIDFKRRDVEKVLREELRGKSLEEMLKIVFELYLRKECGAFDIVSIICEEEAIKPEGKQLFEREWSRREVELMDYVFERHFSANRPRRAAAVVVANTAGKIDVSAWIKDQICRVLKENNSIPRKRKKIFSDDSSKEGH
ncbi:GTPase IMAP family member 8-like isoform X2 [Toxotes jaculatrix]|uniref:GTPase IMAP family member 8-like isoform X2 n=1 Tax=Toxotes jaculatrix TaxID=941984 RepID=UPI001B3AF36E|nr:GTPase IMAP family member 8-like isoform X2 [Toxotes jaculatrix]